VVLLALSEARADSPDFEAPPVHAVADALPPALRYTSLYTVESPVLNDGFMNRYRLRSPLGDFEVWSEVLLRERVRELEALAELQRLSSEEVVLEATGEAAKRLVTGAAESVERVAGLVTDPKRVVETVTDVPAGLGRLFVRGARLVARGIDAAGELLDGQGEPSANQGGSEAGTMTGEAIRSYTGVDRHEAALYRRFNVDPFTDNQALRGEIERVAGFQTAVGTGARFIPGINLGLVGDLAGWVKRAQDLAMFEDPATRQHRILTSLTALGVWPERRRRFLANPLITPTVQNMAVSSLERLPGMTGRVRIVGALARARTRSVVMFYLRATEALARRHRARLFTALIPEFGLVGAVARHGQAVVPLPVDYLVWTEEVATLFGDVSADSPAGHLPPGSEVLIAGRASPRCRRELEGRGLVVVEGVEM